MGTPIEDAINLLADIIPSSDRVVTDDGRLDVNLLTALPLSHGEQVIADTMLELWRGQGLVGRAVSRLDAETYAKWLEALAVARQVNVEV